MNSEDDKLQKVEERLNGNMVTRKEKKEKKKQKKRKAAEGQAEMATRKEEEAKEEKAREALLQAEALKPEKEVSFPIPYKHTLTVHLVTPSSVP